MAVALSVALLVLAALAPSGDFIDEHGAAEVWSGARFLACGWAGPLAGAAGCGWYANPALVLGWVVVALRRYGAATIVLGIAMILALSSFTLFAAEVPQNEGSVNDLRLRAFSLGFYLWLAAVLLPLAVATTLAVRDRARARGERM